MPLVRIDANCDGDDFDADADGWVPINYGHYLYAVNGMTSIVGDYWDNPAPKLGTQWL